MGKFRFESDEITFEGEPTTIYDQPAAAIGNAVSDQRFAGGIIRGVVSFQEVSPQSACQFIVSYAPATRAFLAAGIGSDSMFVVRTFYDQWTYHAAFGDRSMLRQACNYEIEIRVEGSRLTLTVDGVDVLVTILPYVIFNNQAGLWCQDFKKIFIRDFELRSVKPKAFVVMQFTAPYNQLYEEVIRPICDEFQITTLRADEDYGPGLIVADVAKQITEAKLVVAEITPANPNVYYEVGYAHALNKPTILIAEKGTKLPFDVSPFRVLFYENSIEGKRRIEEGFRKHSMAMGMAPILFGR